jgi:diaminohydroxyphosphoribosylaminopyrimidine deaminase/5-amino-6-(5-phosphoribosylamino)uracil reductase
MLDEDYMKRAFELASKGKGTVTPNPLVGAVIVKDNVVVGEGFHSRSGEKHAEINAIENTVDTSLLGATLYCTLEPCCHTNKKTPPCTKEIIKNKISKVVIANLDPNPEVAGNGVIELRAAGIEVVTGVLSDFGENINKIFFKYMKTGLPYVHLKQAMTLDGKTASDSGDSKWITSSVARDEVHELRYEYDAVMVGSNTANLDDPSLTCRKNDIIIKIPKRVIAGKLKNLNANLLLLNDEHKESTIIVQDNSNIEKLKKLSSQGVTSILLEGGCNLASSFIEDGLIDEVSYYIAPKLLGNGTPIYSNDKVKLMSDCKNLRGTWRSLTSGEIVFEGRF